MDKGKKDAQMVWERQKGGEWTGAGKDTQTGWEREEGDKATVKNGP